MTAILTIATKRAKEIVLNVLFTASAIMGLLVITILAVIGFLAITIADVINEKTKAKFPYWR